MGACTEMLPAMGQSKGAVCWANGDKLTSAELEANIGLLDFVHHPGILLERYGASYFIGAGALALITMPITYIIIKRLVELAHKQRAERLRKRWQQRSRPGTLPQAGE